MVQTWWKNDIITYSGSGDWNKLGKIVSLSRHTVIKLETAICTNILLEIYPAATCRLPLFFFFLFFTEYLHRQSRCRAIFVIKLRASQTDFKLLGLQGFEAHWIILTKQGERFWPSRHERRGLNGIANALSGLGWQYMRECLAAPRLAEVLQDQEPEDA